MITIKEESMAVLGEYARVSIAFMVESKCVAVPNECAAGWTLTEERVDPPWIKDYDAVEPPTRWLNQGWDISNWIVISAFSCSERIGGAVIAWKTAGVDFLEGRDDVAVLWDIRVAPAWRRKGIGSVLFRRAIELATIWDCSELKIETQDINAPACRFYAKQGCRLVSVEADAYPDFPKEVRLVWRLGLA